MAATRIGVLALQGDFAAHRSAIERAGGETVEVRRPEQLADVAGLILPGGESTTLLRLIDAFGFEAPLRAFRDEGKPIFGTCAGLILLAREVVGPVQRSLGLLDVTVQRNAYGRQIDSFVETGSLRWNGGPQEPAEMVFIRAPRIIAMGQGVEVLADLRGEPTLVRQGSVWGGTYHPELSAASSVHRRFVLDAGGRSRVHA
jgi:5'-phosphate synthase pdxT subunit